MQIYKLKQNYIYIIKIINRYKIILNKFSFKTQLKIIFKEILNIKAN